MFDPTKPVNSSKIVAAELRSQFNDLKSLIDAVPAGPVGPQGPAGAQGTQGLEGAQGDAGVQGAQGIQGPEGAQGDAGVEGAQGPKGDQGAQGEAGPQGPAGPATTESDPIFAASAAAQFVPGDKAKLDAALTSVPTPTSVNDAAQVPQISDARQLLGADGATVAANWADGVFRIPGMGGAQESVASNDGVSARGLGYGYILMAGGTTAARWPDGTLRDAAGNPFLTALTGRNVSELTNDARYLALSDYGEAVVGAVRINDGTPAVNRIGSNGVGGLSIVSSNFIEIAAQGNGNITINDGSLRHFVDGVNFDYYATQAWVTAHTGLSGHNVSELTNDAGYVTAAYGPANPGYWAGTPPATVAEALDRLAAAVSGNGATPVG